MSDRLKLGTGVVVWLALASGSFPLRAELKPEEIYAAVLPSTMTLEIENTAGQHFVGSAFSALAQGVAVTAWHVIHDARRIEARFADGQRVKVVGLVDKDVDHDLALIKLESSSSPRLPVSANAPRIGSRVYTIGAPKGLDFSMSEGLVSQVRTVDGVRYYQLSSPISPGDSGGPVINDLGQVLGVISWRKADAQNVGFAIPGSVISQLNPALAPLSWPINAPTPVAGKPQDATSQVRVTAPAEPPQDGFAAFQELLNDSAGKTVTMVVEEDGSQKKFTFRVPKK